MRGWLRIVMVGVVAAGAGAGCGGDEWSRPPYVPGAEVPTVVARHGRAAPLAIGDCIVFDYVGVPDGAGGTRADYGSASADDALRFVLDRPVPGHPALPARGYHWLEHDTGGTFAYVSRGEVTATVEVGTAAGLFGVTEVCGGAYGPPDLAWRPPPPPPPVGSTAGEQRLQAANRALFDTLPPVPGASLRSSEPQVVGVPTADATVFRYELAGGRCETMRRYEDALRGVGFVGGAMETSETEGSGSSRVGQYVRDDALVVLAVRTSEPGLIVTVAASPMRPAVALPAAVPAQCTSD